MSHWELGAPRRHFDLRRFSLEGRRHKRGQFRSGPCDSSSLSDLPSSQLTNTTQYSPPCPFSSAGAERPPRLRCPRPAPLPPRASVAIRRPASSAPGQCRRTTAAPCRPGCRTGTSSTCSEFERGCSSTAPRSLERTRTSSFYVVGFSVSREQPGIGFRGFGINASESIEVEMCGVRKETVPQLSFHRHEPSRDARRPPPWLVRERMSIFGPFQFLVPAFLIFWLLLTRASGQRATIS